MIYMSEGCWKNTEGKNNYKIYNEKQSVIIHSSRSNKITLTLTSIFVK